MIKSASDNDKHSSESEVDDQRTIQSFKSNNPYARLMVIGRINEAVKQIFSKRILNTTDIKLLKGIYTVKRDPVR